MVFTNCFLFHNDCKKNTPHEDDLKLLKEVWRFKSVNNSQILQYQHEKEVDDARLKTEETIPYQSGGTFFAPTPPT